MKRQIRISAACMAVSLFAAAPGNAARESSGNSHPVVRFAAPLPTGPLTGTPASAAQGRALETVAETLSQLPAASAAPGKPVPESFGRITGALSRTYQDPGPIRKMWFVHSRGEDLDRFKDVLARIGEENPGVEIVFQEEKSVLPYIKGEDGKEELDDSQEGRKTLYERIRAHGAEFVLASNQDIYEAFRGLRDSELAREIPFGFAGRRFISVDIPRASLNPAVLSDPLKLPYRKYLEITNRAKSLPGKIAGMQGSQVALEELLEAADEIGHGPAKKDEDMGFFERLGMKRLMKLAGQADDPETAKLREKAHHMAAYLERHQADVLVIEDPKTAKMAALMKRMGYHKSLPVIWKGLANPGDASGINMALSPAEWLKDWPHVLAAKPRSPDGTPGLEDAIAQAPKLLRLPDNFMEMGGVSVKDFESKVARAVEMVVPPSPQAGAPRFDVHFMLTNGNGVRRKGDANPFGHFGLAVTDENGKTLVWTVQYNDGGSFTGGLGEGRQLNLAEYLYSLWYLPGAAGQAIPLAETAVSPVFDFILKGAVDEAGLEAMRRVAAYINARHLQGKDNYNFLNKEGMTNCISLVTQILRAAGFVIAETGIQAPGDKAVEMIAGFARRLLNNQVGPRDFGLVIFERPAHAGPEHYRIPNTVLGSPFFNWRKTWKYMTLGEKLRRIASWLPTLIQSFRISHRIEAFARMAGHRVSVGPNSRELEIKANPESPILKLRHFAQEIERLRRERVPIEEELGRLNEELLKAGGLEDWRPNPGLVEEPGSAEGPGKPSEGELAGMRRRHHQLELKLGLSLFDEQIAQRAVEFHKVEIADSLGRYAGRLERIRKAHRKVLATREMMETEDRILNEGEVERLNLLNAEVETELQNIRLEILQDIGPAVPHDMNMIARQVSLKTIDQLLRKSQAGAGGKKEKDKK